MNLDFLESYCCGSNCIKWWPWGWKAGISLAGKASIKTPASHTGQPGSAGMPAAAASSLLTQVPVGTLTAQVASERPSRPSPVQAQQAPWG